VAGGGAVSAWAGRAEEYLRIRRKLGHELAEAAWLLPRFVAYLDHVGTEVVTVDAALAWAQQPQARPGGKVQAVLMTVTRGFAPHMAGIDPRTQVPLLGLLPYRKRWRPPFIYSDADVGALIGQVPRVVRSPLWVIAYQPLIRLLAATGMRVGGASPGTRPGRLGRGRADRARHEIRQVPGGPPGAEHGAGAGCLRPGAGPAVPAAQDTVVPDVHGRDRWPTRISGRRSAASSRPAASGPVPRFARASMTCVLFRSAHSSPTGTGQVNRLVVGR
jgi:hypothetical protein